MNNVDEYDCNGCVSWLTNVREREVRKLTPRELVRHAIMEVNKKQHACLEVLTPSLTSGNHNGIHYLVPPPHFHK